MMTKGCAGVRHSGSQRLGFATSTAPSDAPFASSCIATWYGALPPAQANASPKVPETTPVAEARLLSSRSAPPVAWLPLSWPRKMGEAPEDGLPDYSVVNAQQKASHDPEIPGRGEHGGTIRTAGKCAPSCGNLKSS